jgi:hypothetical protein
MPKRPSIEEVTELIAREVDAGRDLLRFFHEQADKHPRDSEERLYWLEIAHIEFMSSVVWFKRKRGPRDKLILDWKALNFMLRTDLSSPTPISARKLAEMAVDKKLAANRGGRAAQIQRLERFLSSDRAWRRRVSNSQK